MPGDKLRTKLPKIPFKFSLADGASVEKEANVPTNNPLFWLKFLILKLLEMIFTGMHMFLEVSEDCISSPKA